MSFNIEGLNGFILNILYLLINSLFKYKYFFHKGDF